MQASSVAVEHFKKKKNHVQNIPNDIATNPMAPVPPKRSRRAKADVHFMPSTISSTNNDSSDYKVVLTLPQGMAIPTVPQPISYIVPLGTEPDINRERFGFRPPPSANPQARHTAGIQPVLPGSSFPVPPFNPSVPTRVPL